MISVVAVVLGAVIALTGTLCVELIRTRREHGLVLSRLRYDCYLDYMQAFVRANDTLRTVSVDGSARPSEVSAAMRASGVYEARERLLVTGSPQMVFAAEAAFRSLLELRDAIASGRSVVWPDFRPAQDGMADAAWALRQAARREFNRVPLDLGKLAELETPDVSGRLPAGPEGEGE
ncbi:MAG: hypothetical protein HOV83_24980 [Catenulispora sp.]|nr:hypothetical protein [Catenulispora sp.]